MSKQGLLVPFATAPVDASGLSQAGARPGIPVPDAGTTASLAAVGTPAEPAAFDIRTQRGGFPGGRSGAGEDGSSFLYREAGGEWLGWDPPTTITDVQSLFTYHTNADPDLNTVSILDPHIVALPDGTAVCVCAQTTGESLFCQARDPATGLWSEPVAFAPATFASSARQRRTPCLVPLPNGRLLCYAWQWDDDTDLAVVELWVSDDNGATWSLASGNVLPDAVSFAGTLTATDFSLRRLRAAYGDGHVCLLMGLVLNTSSSFSDTVRQYLSTDLGHTFRLIDQLPDSETENGASPDIVWTGSQFLCVMLRKNNTAQVYAEAQLIGGADPISEAESTQVHQATVISGIGTDSIDNDQLNLALALDESGQALVYFYRYKTSDPTTGLVALSQDGGQTWTTAGEAPDYTRWFTDGKDYYPTEISACFVGGQVLMAHRGTHPSGTTSTRQGRALFVSTLGGSTNVTRPRLAGSHAPSGVYGWDHTWQAFVAPADGSVWKDVGTTIGLTTSGYDQFLRWTSSSTASSVYRLLDPNEVVLGLACEFSFRVTSGGTTTNPTVILSADSGFGRYDVAFCASTTGFRLRDHVAGVAGTLVTVDLTQRVDVRIEQRLDTARCWYRVWDPAAPREWLDGGSIALTSGGTATGPRVEFGRPVGGTAVATDWWRMSVAQGADAVGYATEDTDLLGHLFTSAGTSVPGGVRIQSRSGPTFPGDSWSSTPVYDFAIERATDLELPTPRTGWRSEDLTEQQLVWDVDVEGETLGLALFGSNASFIQVHGWDGSSWVSLFTGSRAGDFVARQFRREGLLLRPNAAGDSRYSRLNEHAGAYFSLDASVPGVRIESSGEGVWSSTSGKMPTRLRLVDELTTAAEAITSGVGQIIPRDSVVLLSTGSATYSRIRLSILAATGSGGVAAQPPEDHWTIGTALLGRVQIHADDTSWGRTVDVTAHTETITHRDGTSYTQVLYPPSRTAAYSWVDGVDTTATSGAGTEHLALQQFDDGVGDDGGYRGSAPWTMAGLIAQLDGPHFPVVYLPVLDPDRAYLHRHHELMFGRLTSPVSIETVLGDEDADELVRVASIELEEVV